MPDGPNETIFGAILRGEIPSDKVYEDDLVYAFRDINPAAPTHILVIPKKYVVNCMDCGEEDKEMLGHLMVTAAKIAQDEGLEGYRFVINNGAAAGQTVFHLHAHIIGGRDLSWPPG